MKEYVLGRVLRVILLGILFSPTALAHGGGENAHGGDAGAKNDSEYPPTYFAHHEHSGIIYAHIALMTLAYVFVLPVAVMLSLARSKFTLMTQFIFLAANALGVLLAVIYNAETPDLYPNNAHHKIGWIITWVVCAHVLVSSVGWIAGAVRGHRKGASFDSHRHHFIPVANQDSTYTPGYFSPGYRNSNDSGQGTEPNTDSLRSNSVSSFDEDGLPMESPQKEYHHDDPEDGGFEDMPLSSPPNKSRMAIGATKVASSRIWRYIEIGYRVVDRIILPFGFIAFATGIVTFGRFFEGRAIFGGLAHWIKGGIFFWLGLFTLGRWSGSFGDLGWAWNVRPKKTQKWRPTAEFVESALIFTYGSTNIFLEHLGSWGGEWSGQDFEHLSITVLFIGGGLIGMLIESSRVRDLLNVSVTDTASEYTHDEEERPRFQPPQTYEFSMNPIPALVILLLGIMMGSHQQASMISSMVHKQWGNLLLGASFARGFTYVITYLKPPKSVLPSRPPTELLASFGLISGGIIFMASSSDTVEGMIHYDLDEMFMYTVTMGLVGLLMAWEVVVLAIKGWAVRKERRAQRL